MKDQLCAIFMASEVVFLVAWRTFTVSGRQRIEAEVSSLIFMENRDVELFHDREASECKSFKYF